MKYNEDFMDLCEEVAHNETFDYCLKEKDRNSLLRARKPENLTDHAFMAFAEEVLATNGVDDPKMVARIVFGVCRCGSPYIEENDQPLPDYCKVAEMFKRYGVSM